MGSRVLNRCYKTTLSKVLCRILGKDSDFGVSARANSCICGDIVNPGLAQASVPLFGKSTEKSTPNIINCTVATSVHLASVFAVFSRFFLASLKLLIK